MAECRDPARPPRASSGLTALEFVATVVIGLTMLSLAHRALSPVVAPAVVFPDGRPGAERSAQTALDAIRRDLERLVVPDLETAPGQPVRLSEPGPDGSAQRLELSTPDGAVSWALAPGSGPARALMRNEAVLPGVQLRGLSFRLRESPGDRSLYLEIELDASDPGGRESLRRLDARKLRTSRRVE